MLNLISNLFLLFSIVVLTSCVEGDEEVWINDDASGNIVATYKLPTIALRQIGDPDDFIKALKLIDEKEVMIEITDLSFEVKSGRAIFHLEAKFDDARELLSITERNKPVFSKQTKTDQKYPKKYVGGCMCLYGEKAPPTSATTHGGLSGIPLIRTKDLKLYKSSITIPFRFPLLHQSSSIFLSFLLQINCASRLINCFNRLIDCIGRRLDEWHYLVD